MPTSAANVRTWARGEGPLLVDSGPAASRCHGHDSGHRESMLSVVGVSSEVARKAAADRGVNQA